MAREISSEASGLAASDYNYERFDAYIEAGEHEREADAFRQSAHAGAQALDGELTRLDGGGRVRLSELWRRRGVVLEFGSFT